MRLTHTQLHTKIYEMEYELSFLWREASDEPDKNLRERKFRQYWDMYRIFRKQREFLFALAEVGPIKRWELTNHR